MQEYVLSDEEIVRLKHYIEQKHQDLNPQQKAPILADAVHRIIESRLPAFPAVVKKRIRNELLLKNKERLTIDVDDVLQHCMSLDLKEEAHLFPLAAWVCSRSEIPLQEDKVRLTLTQLKQQPIPLARLHALARDMDHTFESATMEHAASSEDNVSLRGTRWLDGRFIIKASVLLIIVLLMMLVPPLDQPSSTSATNISPIDMSIPVIDDNSIPHPSSGIPAEFRYVSVDTVRLQNYLVNKKSTLAKEPYMSAIINAGKQYDIHPILLFAITGQEQGFVPTTQSKAAEIANNPFNVFGSWESYNTSIEASAAIAAKTVANISSRRPEDNHPMQWLNQTYAEDPNWWKGVTWFFNEMLQEIEDDSFIWNE